MKVSKSFSKEKKKKISGKKGSGEEK